MAKQNNVKQMPTQSNKKTDFKAEYEAQLKRLEELENKRKVEVLQQIQAIEKESGYFCGIILDHAGLLKVMENALQSGKPIKIPFGLYKQ